MSEATEDFSRPADVVGDTDMARQRRFFKCEDWSNADLDDFVELLRHYPGGEWMDGFGDQVKRQYAMSCIRLKEDDRDAFERQIVQGRAWLSFGSTETAP